LESFNVSIYGIKSLDLMLLPSLIFALNSDPLEL